MPTLDGRPVTEAYISEPITGRWWAEVSASGTDDLTGSVALEIGGVTWTGTVASSALDAERRRVVLRGGTGGLDLAIVDRWYRGSPNVETLVGDILRDAGEQLDSASDAAVLGQVVSQWHRLAGLAHEALSALTLAIGASWRVTRAGRVLVTGPPTYPAALAPGPVLTDDGAREVLSVAAEVPSTEPGVAVLGHRITRTVWTLTPSALRGALYYYPAPSPSSREQEAGALWTAGLDQRRADGTLDLIASARYGLTQLPYFSGLPGVDVRPKPGAQLLGAFARGDTRAPVAFAATGSGGLKIGTLLAAVSPIGSLLSLEFFAPDAAGEAAMLAAIAAILLAGNLPVPPIGLPLTITVAVQQ